MTKKIKTIIGYVIFVFLLQSIVVFLPQKYANLYLLAALMFMAITAVIFQKFVHKKPFIDMGFRLNRNAVYGILIGLFFLGIVVGINVFVLVKLGFMKIKLNEIFTDVNITKYLFTGIPVSVAIAFLLCLFGEELVFRGYLLPKLDDIYGKVKAVLICSLIFALWHLPVYYSTYAGGAASGGWKTVSLMLIAHGLGSIPICILYLTTRELYGLSLYHALVDIINYSILGNPAFGEASKNALYVLEVSNEKASEVIGWVWLVLGIVVMYFLCVVYKKLRLVRWKYLLQS